MSAAAKCARHDPEQLYSKMEEVVMARVSEARNRISLLCFSTLDAARRMQALRPPQPKGSEHDPIATFHDPEANRYVAAILSRKLACRRGVACNAKGGRSGAFNRNAIWRRVCFPRVISPFPRRSAQNCRRSSALPIRAAGIQSLRIAPNGSSSRFRAPRKSPMTLPPFASISGLRSKRRRWPASPYS